LAAAAAQMQRTLQHLEGLLPRLLSRLGWRESVIDTVAFVVTSAWEFSGVHVAGVPVVDFSYLEMLLNGARISTVREEVDGTFSIAKVRLIKGLHPTGPIPGP
jgi:hypothetical protein